MSRHILFCKACNVFTMKDKCPECGNETLQPSPPKYSPDDQYAEYRRKVKRGELEKQGLL